MSRWLTEVARSRTSSSPGPGTGSGTSSSRRVSGPPWAWMRTARTSADGDDELDLDQQLGQREPADAGDHLRWGRGAAHALAHRAPDRLVLGRPGRVDGGLDD